MREKGKKAFFRAIIYSVLLTILLPACSSSRKIDKNYLYFKSGADTVATLQKETLIQANDLLNIQVYSRTLNQEQAAIFNIPPSSAGSFIQGYQVSATGFIEMPVIGPVQAAGLTKTELQNSLIQKLANNVRSPSVIVRFLQFNINVLGEVRIPGTQRFTVDRVTIIDAIGAAGDLTDFGMRENVTVIREDRGKRITHTVDLRSKSIFTSPVYILQPNDIVYVSPNKYKLKNLDVNPEVQRKTGFVTNVLTIILSLTTVILYITR